MRFKPWKPKCVKNFPLTFAWHTCTWLYLKWKKQKNIYQQTKNWIKFTNLFSDLNIEAICCKWSIRSNTQKREETKREMFLCLPCSHVHPEQLDRVHDHLVCIPLLPPLSSTWSLIYISINGVFFLKFKSLIRILWQLMQHNFDEN